LVIGFAIQMGGVGAVANLGGTPPLNAEHIITLFGKPFGIFGQNGLFLVHRGTYDVSVMVLFLFQMVFMDRPRRLSQVHAVSAGSTLPLSFDLLFGRFYLSPLCQLGLGRRLACQPRYQFRTGEGLLRFCWIGSRAFGGRNHRTGRRNDARTPIGKYERSGKSNAILAHDIVIVLTGCFI